MMEFEELWSEFSWGIDELKNGMAFFEGYLPSINNSDIEPCLDEIARLDSVKYSCEPCWMNDSDIPDKVQDYSISECVNLFCSGKLASFEFGYTRDYNGIISNQKLMFMTVADKTEVTLICFADWILTSKNPKLAIELAIVEMREIKSLLQSSALYIGPDGLDLSGNNYLKID